MALTTCPRTERGQVVTPRSTAGKVFRMSLKDYDVEINGMKTTLRLSEDEAKARGLEAKKAPAPANKARSATTKKKS